MKNNDQTCPSCKYYGFFKCELTGERINHSHETCKKFQRIGCDEIIKDAPVNTPSFRTSVQAPNNHSVLKCVNVDKIMEARKEFFINYVDNVKSYNGKQNLIDLINKLLPLPKWYTEGEK